MSGSGERLRLLEADAHYARERASQYRARAWSRKEPTSDQRMRQLESAAESAAARLQRARAAAASAKTAVQQPFDF